jgi:signal transduction histidine kinase
LSLVIAVWFLARSLSQPVLALTKATDKLGEEQWDVQIPTSRILEVDRMGLAFRQMSNRLRTSIQRQAQIEEERRRFIAAISHDLRTPLFSIRGYIQGLLDGVANTPDQIERYLLTAADKAAQLDRLVTDLFEYSRLEYPEHKLTLEWVESESFLRGVLNGARVKADEKGVSLSLEVRQGTPSLMQIDPHLLGRALDNLLDNAIRHTPTGGRVMIIMQPGPILSIKDTGEGIPKEELHRVFEPLYRVDSSRSRRTGGAGLGLAIAKKAVEAHGGKITVESTVGHGTTFHLYLLACVGT